MRFSSREILRIFASSSLCMQQANAWRLSAQVVRPVLFRSPRLFSFSRGWCSTGTATSMGPVHGSADLGGKVKHIRSLLQEHHDRPADGLQVIMDFDLTMTAPGSEQCHHMFETSSALPEKLRSRLAPFFTGGIELTTREAWWEGFHAELCDARVTRAQVAAVAGGAHLNLRHGTAELLVQLQERGVPLLIVSAGITDIVAETLRLHGLLLDNVTVRANTMLFGQDGRLERFRESPPVHSRNKDQTAEREREYFDSHGQRRCVIVVGDKPGDADVTAGFAPDESCLKIGFFDHSREHPHPDLPPLPPPPPPPLAAKTGGAGGAGENDRGQPGGSAVRERLGFLRESNGLVLGATASGSRLGGGDETPRSSSSEDERIQGRPGSQGGGELYGHPPNTTVAAEDLLRAYRDSFDVVACGGHSMDLVTDFVGHFVGTSSSSQGGLAAAAGNEAARGGDGRGRSPSPPTP